jgi:hypothetical protein
MTLADYCRQLGWDASTLARQANINYRTAKKALDGEAITSRSAREIAEALSKAFGMPVYVGDIQGLSVQ